MRPELAFTIGKAGSYHLREQTTAGSTRSALPVPGWLLLLPPLPLRENAGHVAQPWVCQEVHLSCLSAPASTLFPCLPLPWTKMSTTPPQDEKAQLCLQYQGALSHPLQNVWVTSACLFYPRRCAQAKVSKCLHGKTTEVSPSMWKA